MTAKPPMRNKLYRIPEAAQLWDVPETVLYAEIKAGRLHAKMRRGALRGYFVTESIMDDWIENSMVDVFDVLHATEYETSA